MIFADNPHDREIEKMMQKTPHFRPRGHGVFVSEKRVQCRKVRMQGVCRQKEEKASVGRKNALCGATNPRGANPTAEGADGNLHGGNQPRIYYPNQRIHQGE